MIVGLDFDNTIVCYDTAIQILADKVLDIPESVPKTKLGVRNYLRSEQREPEWTMFQGYLYGPGMEHAKPFAGVVEAVKTMRELGHQVIVISHRTRFPYAGEKHDLHAAAREWLDLNFKSGTSEFISQENIYFLETRGQKIKKIISQGCRVFVDDLPEVLAEDQFPRFAQAILFDPDNKSDAVPGNWLIMSHWSDLPEMLQRVSR